MCQNGHYEKGWPKSDTFQQKNNVFLFVTYSVNRDVSHWSKSFDNLGTIEVGVDHIGVTSEPHPGT